MTARGWLSASAGGAPPNLLAAMLEAIDDDVEGSIPDHLARAATNLYRQVIAGTGGREDALPLLAADALLSGAFQAQAELDPTGLSKFVERWNGLGQLGESHL